MQKILAIDDDETILEELKSLLSNAGYQFFGLKNLNQAEEQIFKLKPDLILLDIQIPMGNGELFLKNLRKKTNVPIIMVTSKNTEVDEVLSMSYGADDYITKPYNPTILLLRIQTILRRKDQNFSTLTYRDIQVNVQKGMLTKGEKEIILTKNEMIIFTYLLQNQGKIVTRDELMTDLWNNAEYVNDNALTVNISRLRSKLEEIGQKDVIETRKGQGYLLL